MKKKYKIGLKLIFIGLNLIFFVYFLWILALMEDLSQVGELTLI